MKTNTCIRHNLNRFMSFIMVVICARFYASADFSEDSIENKDNVIMNDVTDLTLSVKPNPNDLVSNFQPIYLKGMSMERKSIYKYPYSITRSEPDWKRMWLNTGVLAGAFIGTLVVLECLPEDATSWNRSEIQSVPPFKRWRQNVLEKGPEWDHDKFYFNYILHPYAGAAYYMGARSCGFNAWQSLLYCTFISTVFWEFGIEAFMERPSIQDLFITPLVGSLIGEGFYKLKRKIVENDYHLAGSPVLGNIVVFLIDPINEVIGLFAGNDCRKLNKRKSEFTSSIVFPTYYGANIGFALQYTF